MSRKSNEIVIPEYFETCFSAKYTRDEKSYEMILMATESRSYDLGNIYDYGKNATTFRNSAEKGNEGIVSALESIRPAAELAIEEIHGKN